MNRARVIITGKQLGMGTVVPYSHAQGLQFLKNGRPVLYRVPIFEVRIDGGAVYRAIRFGVQNKGTVEKHRGCDAGLSQGRECTPEWVPGYSPHSFRGASRAGAWRLLPGKGFLIHEGADTTQGQVGGSLGCVEILDGFWNSFLSQIEAIAGAQCPEIGLRHLLTVTIEAATPPVADLIES